MRQNLELKKGNLSAIIALFIGLGPLRYNREKMGKVDSAKCQLCSEQPLRTEVYATGNVRAIAFKKILHFFCNKLRLKKKRYSQYISKSPMKLGNNAH